MGYSFRQVFGMCYVSDGRELSFLQQRHHESVVEHDSGFAQDLNERERPVHSRDAKETRSGDDVSSAYHLFERHVRSVSNALAYDSVGNFYVVKERVYVFLERERFHVDILDAAYIHDLENDVFFLRICAREIAHDVVVNDHVSESYHGSVLDRTAYGTFLRMLYVAAYSRRVCEPPSVEEKDAIDEFLGQTHLELYIHAMENHIIILKYREINKHKYIVHHVNIVYAKL